MAAHHKTTFCLNNDNTAAAGQTCRDSSDDLQGKDRAGVARTGDVGRGNAPSPYLQQRQRLGDSYRDSTEQHNAAQMVTDDNRTGRALQGDARDWGERFEPFSKKRSRLSVLP